jgi:Tol biopolymer transport system component
MRRSILAVLAFLVIPLAAQQPTPRELFERARLLEESNRSLAEAIAVYTQVAARSDERELAAAALLRVGLLHQRAGRTTEAERVFRRLVTGYADQAAIASQARERLTAAGETAGPGVLGARRVWDDPVGAPLASPSPDGRSLSFTDWTTGDLALRDLASGSTRRLTNGGLTSPGPGGYAYGSRFSPDGARVVFNWFKDDGSSFDLRTVRIDTLDERVLYRNDQLSYFQPYDWSQDGTRVLMLFTRLDGVNQIASISMRDGSARILKTLDWRPPGGMAFSPDGRWVVYDFRPSDEAPERDVYVLAADGSRETRLIEHAADDFALGWAPNGHTVLFASDRTGTYGAWTIDVADGRAAGAPQLVRADIGARVDPIGFDRTGRFYYFATTALTEIYTASLDLATGRTVVAPAPLPGRVVGMNELTDWSPDGRSLALLRQPPGRAAKQIVIRTPSGNEEREIRPDLGSLTNWLRWSPDGAAILVSGRDRRNRDGLFRVDAHTGATTAIVRPNPRSPRPEWAADGKGLFYLRRDDTCACVVRRDLATGEEVEVFRMPRSDRSVTMAPSPDGRHLAVLWFGPPGRSPSLSLVPAGGGEARALYEGDDLAWFNFVAWMPDSRFVLFGRHQAERRRVVVWRVAVEGGAPVRLDLAMEGLRDLRVSPDGIHVAFTAGQNRGEVWVLENLLASSSGRAASRLQRLN